MNAEAIRQTLAQARNRGDIPASAHDLCSSWLKPGVFDDWVLESIAELVEGAHWEEVTDRFYKTLAFGTGGLRGRTIGRVITRAERGSSPEGACPEHPAVGSNCMNDFNVRRATMGLVAYVKRAGSLGPSPHVVFAHDPRHFSRHFAELAARAVMECGGHASLFESERSTPELSFAVRHLRADAGVVITASHNPPHDNGFKAYFNDGAQVIEPHASGIIREVNSVALESVARAGAAPSVFGILGRDVDEAYLARLHELVLEPELVKQRGGGLKTVYSALHGTGAKMIPTIFAQIGCELLPVAEQMKPDGRFPTVKSPNPENAEALSMGIALAERGKADLVMATDPDGDRMGVAVRDSNGAMKLITGNQIGSILAHYRLERLFAQGVLHESNRRSATLIKTVVTTDLQKAIADKFGVSIVETLTGFKYIGEKLRKYEERVCAATGMTSPAYRDLPELRKRELLLKHSRYYVFGGEESYGYSASDYARDKDANAACVMFAEAAVFAQSKGVTILDYLDSIYSQLGYYEEKLGQLVYEGAEGAARIKAILESYESSPPREMGGQAVTRIMNHAKEEVRDSEGETLPRELLLFVDMANGARYAVRGSGTEPKIKFYMSAHRKPPAGKSFSRPDLDEAKAATHQFLDSAWKAIEGDARRRAGA